MKREKLLKIHNGPKGKWPGDFDLPWSPALIRTAKTG
jgi:hypothetical protein